MAEEVVHRYYEDASGASSRAVGIILVLALFIVLLFLLVNRGIIGTTGGSFQIPQTIDVNLNR